MKTIKGRGLSGELVYFEGVSKSFIVLGALGGEELMWESERMHQLKLLYLLHVNLHKLIEFRS